MRSGTITHEGDDDVHSCTNSNIKSAYFIDVFLSNRDSGELNQMKHELLTQSYSSITVSINHSIQNLTPL